MCVYIIFLCNFEEEDEKEEEEEEEAEEGEEENDTQEISNIQVAFEVQESTTTLYLLIALTLFFGSKQGIGGQLR